VVETATCRICGATVPEGNDCDCPKMFVQLVDLMSHDIGELEVSAGDMEPHSTEAFDELMAIAGSLKAWREKWLAIAKEAAR
jgi:hypothetical protein